MSDLSELLDHCRERQSFYAKQAAQCAASAEETDDAGLREKRLGWSKKKSDLAAKWQSWAEQVAEVVERGSFVKWRGE